MIPAASCDVTDLNLLPAQYSSSSSCLGFKKNLPTQISFAEKL